MAKPQRTISGESIANAVNLANDVRRHMGIDLLEDLPRSAPSDAHHCVLARAFNFNCSVCSAEDIVLDGIDGRTNWGLSNSLWQVNFPNRKAARALAKSLGVKVVDRAGESDRWAVLLPREVGNIAADFDNGLLSRYEITKPRRELLQEISEEGEPITEEELRERGFKRLSANLKFLVDEGFITAKDRQGVTHYTYLGG